MRDHVNAREGDEPARRQNGSSPDMVLSDREVPLDGLTLSSALQALLDGDVGEDSARNDGATERDLRFWRRVEMESAHRRRMSAPDGFAASVMSAIARGDAS